jgi:hypothetical protein
VRWRGAAADRLMTILEVAIHFVISVLLIGGLVYMGYVELCRRKEVIVGLSTWAFAILPFLGALIGIASLQIIWLPVRIGLIILLAVGAWSLLSQLFKKARATFGHFSG